MNRKPMTPETGLLLSPGVQRRLSNSEAIPQPIPRGSIQSTLGEIAIWLDNDLPVPESHATLHFQNGKTSDLIVLDYSKDTVHVGFAGFGDSINKSSLPLQVFSELVRPIEI